MYKLTLAPDQSGYAAAEGAKQVYNRLDGGSGRTRRDYLNGVYKVDVQWTATEDDYLYLQTFHRVTMEGSEPFLMDLLLTDYQLKEYECRFIPGTWRLTTVKGQSYIVKAQLEVNPGVNDDDLDAGIVITYEAFGPEGGLAYTDIAKFVNVTMPANLK